MLNKDEVKRWNASNVKSPSTNDATDKSDYSLTFETSFAEEPTLERTILLRGSSRKFSEGTISFTQLSNILYYATHNISMDYMDSDSSNNRITSDIDISVAGTQAGAYYYHPGAQGLLKLKSGTFREISGYLCLGQSLFVNSNALFFLMVDLDKILEILGNRGYRSSQFEAGVIAGKIYFAAYAQKIGASGSTFFDDAVTEFFSPHAKTKSTMMAVGVGIPGYTSRSGKILAGKVTRAEILKYAKRKP